MEKYKPGFYWARLKGSEMLSVVEVSRTSRLVGMKRVYEYEAFFPGSEEDWDFDEVVLLSGPLSPPTDDGTKADQ